MLENHLLCPSQLTQNTREVLGKETVTTAIRPLFDCESTARFARATTIRETLELYGSRLFTYNCNVARRKYIRIKLTEKPENSKPNPSLTLMLTLLLAPTLLGRCKQKQRGLRGHYVAGPPLLNERCTSLLRAPRLRNDLYCTITLLPTRTLYP